MPGEPIFEFNKTLARKRIFEELKKYNEQQQEALITRAGLTGSYKYQVKENNEEFPSLQAIGGFAKALGKPIEYFIYENYIFHTMEIDGKKLLNIPYICDCTDEHNLFIYTNEKAKCLMEYDWLLRLTDDPTGLVLFIMNNDSMESLFRQYNELLIDTSRKSIIDGGIYAFNTPDYKSIRIRRFFITMDSLKIVPENKSFEFYYATKKDINILGNIIAFKHFFVREVTKCR